MTTLPSFFHLELPYPRHEFKDVADVYNWVKLLLMTLEEQKAIASQATSLNFQYMTTEHIGGACIGTIGTTKIDDSAITTTKLDDACIIASKIATGAVEEAKIALNAVTTTRIANDSITSPKIVADAVTATKINVVGLDGTTGRICVVDDTDANEVTGGVNSYATTLINAGKILISGSTTLDDWGHASDATLIDGGDIYTNSITANQIASSTITTSELNFTPFVIGTNDLDDVSDGSTYAKVLNTDITSGHILLSACTGDLDDITDGSNYGKVALTSISAGKIVVAGLDSGVTDRMFADSTTKTNIEAWRHASDVTTIDGGDIYTSSITASQIASDAITASKINVSDFIGFPSDENLVGYWSLDEGSGTLAVDGSGNGNDGTLTNMEEGDWIAGIVGTGLDFDGVNEYVDCGNDTSLRIKDQSWTLSFWFNTITGSSDYRVVIGIMGSGSWHILTHEDSFYFRMKNTGGTAYDFGSYKVSVDNGEWVHGAFSASRVGDNVTVSTYKNGALVGSQVLTVSGVFENTDPLRIWSGVDVAGLVDEVRIYNHALTASEIKALYLYPAGNKSVKISGGQIVANTITANEIQASTITANELVLNQRQYWLSVAGSTIRNSNDTEQNTTSDTYNKVKETKLNEDTGEITIYFELKSLDAGVDVFAKIYVNGNPEGIERSTNSTTYQTYSQDLGGYNEDDLVQIYAYRTGGTRAYVRNLRFKYDRAVTVLAGVELASPLATSLQTAFSMTNQDP